MNLLRKGAALLLAASLCVLSACGERVPAPEKETVMGRYIEESWELPMDAVNISVLERRPDGKIFAIMNDRGSNKDGENVTIKGYTTSDGKDWQEDTPAWLDAVLAKDGFVRDVAYGKNGECLFIYSVIEGDHYFIRVARVLPDGTFEDIDGEWGKATQSTDSAIVSAEAGDSSEEAAGEDTSEPEQDDAAESIGQDYSFYPTGITVGDDGDLYISHFNGVARFDTDGRFKINLDSYYPMVTYYNGGLAIMDSGSVRGGADSLRLYNTDSSEVMQELNLQALQDMGDGMHIATGPDSALYAANPSGIYRLVPGGTTWERMVDGDLCSLSVPSMSILGFLSHGDNQFLTLTVEQDSPVLINYVYSASVPTRPDTELTIITLRKNSTLLQAAGEFRRQHPEVLITVQTLLEEDGSATTADAVRALNTQLLAGKGPDLLLLDGLPIESYIEKGVLADMSDWLAPIAQQELVPNITGALEKNGKLYAVPARFNMPTIWGRPDAIQAAANLESLVQYAQRSTDNHLLYDMSKQSLFRYFSATSAPIWLDSRGRLDETAFAEYLERIDQLAATAPGAGIKVDDIRMGPGFTMTGIDTGGAQDLPFGKASLFSAELDSFQSLMIPNGAISALHGLVITPEHSSIEENLLLDHVALLPGQAAGVFVPRCIMGINAAGEQQELAREFVLTVLGETVQYSDLQDGFPVNRAAIEKNITRFDDLYWAISWDDEDTGEERMIEMGWPSPGVFRVVCGLFDQLTTPYLLDDTLMEMILGETEAFFSGSSTARETAAAASARLEVYLAEQG